MFEQIDNNSFAEKEVVNLYPLRKRNGIRLHHELILSMEKQHIFPQTVYKFSTATIMQDLLMLGLNT